MTNLRAMFIAAGPQSWASARLRAYWVADKIKDAAAMSYQEFERLKDRPAADNVVFQKYFSGEIAKHYKSNGAKVFYDACDPAWWWSPKEMREVADLCDGLVFCNQNLSADFADWYGDGRKSFVIPDRLDLTHYDHRRIHADVKPVRFIWFGVAVNRIALFAALANLERLAANGHKIELTICDDKSADWKFTNEFPVYHTEWQLDTEAQTIAAHDVALLPPYPGAWGRVKSNNKKLTAWACGLPVTTGEDYDQLNALVTLPDMRATLGKVGRRATETDWAIETSAIEWEQILK